MQEFDGSGILGRIGHVHGRWPHIHAAPPLPKVERRLDSSRFQPLCFLQKSESPTSEPFEGFEA